LIFLDIDPELF